MRYCPNCFAEYEDFATDCIDCEVPLADSMAEAEEVEGKMESVLVPVTNFVTVFESTNSWEAQTVKSLLESNEIPCKVLGALESNYPPTMPIEVQVPEDLEDEATELMGAYQNNPVTDFGN